MRTVMVWQLPFAGARRSPVGLAATRPHAQSIPHAAEASFVRFGAAPVRSRCPVLGPWERAPTGPLRHHPAAGGAPRGPPLLTERKTWKKYPENLRCIAGTPRAEKSNDGVSTTHTAGAVAHVTVVMHLNGMGAPRSSPRKRSAAWSRLPLNIRRCHTNRRSCRHLSSQNALVDPFGNNSMLLSQF